MASDQLKTVSSKRLLEELKHLPRDSGLDIVERDSHEMNAVISAEMCQRRLKIQPKGGAKDCHLGWWSALGVRLGVGDVDRRRILTPHSRAGSIR